MLSNTSLDENLLLDFFNKAELTEFKKLWSAQLPSKEKTPSQFIEPDREQLETGLPPFHNYPEDIQLLITFAERKLSAEKFIQLLLHLGDYSIAKGELDTATEVYELLLRKVKNDKQMTNFYAYSMLALGDIFSRKANWKQSINYINRANSLFLEQNDYEGHAKCENLLGTIFGDRGKVEKAYSHFEQSLLNLNPAVDITLIGMIEINLGIINNIQGNYDEAYSYYQRALVKFEQTKNIRRMAEIRQNLGMYFIQKEEFSFALEELDQSISFSITSGFMPTLSVSFLNKALVYTRLNDYPLAGAFADKSLEIAHRLDDKLTIADDYKIKGIIERDRHEYLLSENYFITSIRLNKELGNILNEAETSYELAQLYIQMKNKVAAEQLMMKVLRLYKRLQADEMVNKIKDVLRTEF